MLGAILGDIVGSPYEFDHNNYKHKDFLLLSEKSHFTDDTVMTVAVARGLMAGQGDAQKTFAEVPMRSTPLTLPSAETALWAWARIMAGKKLICTANMSARA